MATFVRTLQQKASRSHLRQSTVDPKGQQGQVTGGDNNGRGHPTAQAANPARKNSVPVNNPSSAPASTSSTGSLRFWRKQSHAPIPQSFLSSSPTPGLLPLQESPNPRPILQRTPSPSAPGSVRFPNGIHPQRVSIVPPSGNSHGVYGAPPAGNRQSYFASPHAYPTRGVSPSGSVRSAGTPGAAMRPGVHRYQTSPDVMSGGPSASGGSSGVLLPSAALAAYSSNDSYDPLDASGRARSPVDDRRKTMYRPSPPCSPYGEARGERRVSRTPSEGSTATDPGPQAQQQSQPPPLLQQMPRRPVSSLSNGSRRRSSRKSLPSSSRTRESITSLSSIKSGSSGLSPSLSPSLSPVSPTIPLSQGHGGPSLSPTLIVTPVLQPSPTFNRPALASTGGTLTTVPQSPDSGRSTPLFGVENMCPATPTSSSPLSPFASPSLASTPGGACPWSPNPLVTPNANGVARSGSTSIRRRTQNVQSTGEGSHMPLFKVIPATPLEKTARPMALSELNEEEEVIQPSDKLARVLDFGEPNWETGASSPNLNDAIPLLPGSPITLPTPQMIQETDDENTESRSPTPTTPGPKPSPQSPATPPQNPRRNSARVLATPGTPPPKPAKNPARRRSLYQGHDDGRSVSRSLAELATIACDLPPFGAEMTAAAAEAGARLAAARAATDTPPRNTISRDRRAPPCAPPQLPPPPIPTDIARFSFPGKRRSPTPPPTTTRQQPASSSDATGSISSMSSVSSNVFDSSSSSPEFSSSFPSLPSLVSHGSVPSNSSSVEFYAPYPYDSTTALDSIMSDTDESLLAMIRQLSTRSDSLTPSIDDSLVSPTTPKAMPADTHMDVDVDNEVNLNENPGLGLGYDFSMPCSPPSVSPRAAKLDLGSPIRSPCSPQSQEVEFPLPPSPPLRIHRMSAAAANPNRAAFYGTASFLVRATESTTSLNNYDYASCEEGSDSAPRALAMPANVPTHVSQGSISSISTASGSIDFGSDVDEDEVLTASLVAFRPYAPAKYVVREDPRAHEVGVAF